MPNVLNMSRRINSLTDRLGTLGAKLPTVDEKRAAMEGGLCQQLLENFENLSRLATVSNLDMGEQDALWKGAKSHLDEAMTHSGESPRAGADTETSKKESVGSAPGTTSSNAAASSSTRAGTGTMSGAVAPPNTVFSRLSRKEEAASYITKEQFAAVPVSVRGRCKLVDMHAIIEHCIAKKGCTVINRHPPII
jgi:hypothetical protein